MKESVNTLFTLFMQLVKESICNTGRGTMKYINSSQSVFLCVLTEDIQATRAGMMTSILLSAGALLMSVVGMKCTRFMDQRTEAKSCFAMTGGIIFMVAGVF